MNLAAFVNSTVHKVQTNQLTLKAAINRVLKRIKISGLRKNSCIREPLFLMVSL